MWTFLVIVSLLHQSQAAPVPGDPSSSLQFILQQQQDQTMASAVPDAPQQQTSSSSSASSSSSDTSESSQSSEGPQQMRERQKLENTAVEQMESSQESSELLQSPSNSNTSLLLSELVLLGERAAHRDGGRDTGDDSVENSQHRSLILTFHPLLTQPRSRKTSVTADAGGAPTFGGLVPVTEGALTGTTGRDGDDAELHRALDDSREKADGLTFDLLDHPHHHGYHGNEAGLELGL